VTSPPPTQPSSTQPSPSPDAWRVEVTLPDVPTARRDELLDRLFALLRDWAPADLDWDPMVVTRPVSADEVP